MEAWFRYSYEYNFINIIRRLPDIWYTQIWCSVVLGAQSHYVDVYKPYICVQGCNQEFFMAGEVLAKKGTIYGRYYSYIISVIYNTLISLIYFYNFTCTLSLQQKSELLLVTSPVRKFPHFVISTCLKDAFPKCFLLCVNPELSMFCSQNSGENCSIRFRAGEASQFSPLVASLVLHFYHVLVCCSLKFLPPKEIKETEIEGYGSLKGERWGKNK